LELANCPFIDDDDGDEDDGVVIGSVGVDINVGSANCKFCSEELR